MEPIETSAILDKRPDATFAYLPWFADADAVRDLLLLACDKNGQVDVDMEQRRLESITRDAADRRPRTCCRPRLECRSRRRRQARCRSWRLWSWGRCTRGYGSEKKEHSHASHDCDGGQQ